MDLLLRLFSSHKVNIKLTIFPFHLVKIHLHVVKHFVLGNKGHDKESHPSGTEPPLGEAALHILDKNAGIKTQVQNAGRISLANIKCSHFLVGEQRVKDMILFEVKQLL